MLVISFKHSACKYAGNARFPLHVFCFDLFICMSGWLSGCLSVVLSTHWPVLYIVYNAHSTLVSLFGGNIVNCYMTGENPVS